MANRKLTIREVQTIIDHNMSMIEAAEAAKRNYQQLPKPMRTPAIESTIQYWKHGISALKWSNAVARQRMEKLDNEQRSTV